MSDKTIPALKAVVRPDTGVDIGIDLSQLTSPEFVGALLASITRVYVAALTEKTGLTVAEADIVEADVADSYDAHIIQGGDERHLLERGTV